MQTPRRSPSSGGSPYAPPPPQAAGHSRNPSDTDSLSSFSAPAAAAAAEAAEAQAVGERCAVTDGRGGPLTGQPVNAPSPPAPEGFPQLPRLHAPAPAARPGSPSARGSQLLGSAGAEAEDAADSPPGWPAEPPSPKRQHELAAAAARGGGWDRLILLPPRAASVDSASDSGLQRARDSLLRRHLGAQAGARRLGAALERGGASTGAAWEEILGMWHAWEAGPFASSARAQAADAARLAAIAAWALMGVAIVVAGAWSASRPHAGAAAAPPPHPPLPV